MYLQGVQFETEDVLIAAAHLGVLHQGVLDLPGHGHRLPQQRGVVPEIRLISHTTTNIGFGFETGRGEMGN